MSDYQHTPPTESNMEAVFSHYKHLGMWSLLRPFGRAIVGRPLGPVGAAVSQSGARGTITVTPSPGSAELAAEVVPPIVVSGRPFPELLLASEIVVLGDKTDEGHLIERVGISFRAVF